MADAAPFAKLVPGFDFLQGLVKNAGAAIPGIGQWVAPTLDPKEIEKRIEELKTVQFWLEQNARMIGATIQALEVQRMTLSTLQTMNVQMADLRDSLTIRMPGTAPLEARGASATAPAAAAGRTAREAETDGGEAGGQAPDAAPTVQRARKKPSDGATPAAAPKPGGAVDPLQWWGALTRQFSDLAASALKETAADAAKSFGAITSGGRGEKAAVAAAAADVLGDAPAKSERGARSKAAAKKRVKRPAARRAQP